MSLCTGTLLYETDFASVFSDVFRIFSALVRRLYRLIEVKYHGFENLMSVCDPLKGRFFTLEQALNAHRVIRYVAVFFV